MLAYRIYNNATDVPANVTFSPSEKNTTFFVRARGD
jgi:hypothetical protein